MTSQRTASNLVLVCEDDRATLELLRKIVEAIGYTPVCANTGELAWNIYENNPHIALVLTDIGLPDIDGKELIARMTESNREEKKPIIVLSGIITPNQISDLLMSGVDRCLPKPLVRSDLVDALQKCLQKN